MVRSICSAAMSRAFRLVGDRALLRTFEGPVAEANRAAISCARELTAVGSGIDDVVPGARSVLVLLSPGAPLTPDVEAILDRETFPADEPGTRRTVAFPVRYGGDDGPDLADVASRAGLSQVEVVGAHSSADYVVGFVGFSPGFAYLLGLDERIAVPRLDTPRPRVPSGSVGIGGAYTGVYPRATPGGWRLIGRTDIELFDPGRDPPALLRPGDRVRFVPR